MSKINYTYVLFFFLLGDIYHSTWQYVQSTAIRQASSSQQTTAGRASSFLHWCPHPDSPSQSDRISTGQASRRRVQVTHARMQAECNYNFFPLLSSFDMPTSCFGPLGRRQHGPSQSRCPQELTRRCRLACRSTKPCALQCSRDPARENVPYACLRFFQRLVGEPGLRVSRHEPPPPKQAYSSSRGEGVRVWCMVD